MIFVNLSIINSDLVNNCNACFSLVKMNAATIKPFIYTYMLRTSSLFCTRHVHVHFGVVFSLAL